jgi:hypothetical protein
MFTEEQRRRFHPLTFEQLVDILSKIYNNKNQKMKKTTSNRKTTSKVVTKSTNPYTTTRVANNVGRMPNGMYRARKTVNGVSYSRNFPKLKDAKAWIASL